MTSNPIPGTSSHKRWHRSTQPGVSANSRILSHQYADERVKGKRIRRLVRRLEKRSWQREAQQKRTDGE